MERLIAVAQIETGKDRASVVNMPLVDFVSVVLKPRSPDQGSAGTIEGAKTSAKRRGRKKADYETIRKEAALNADWQRAREAGIRKIEFARDKSMTVKDLDKLLDRVGKRNSLPNN
jgi:hypothetical protein